MTKPTNYMNIKRVTSELVRTSNFWHDGFAKTLTSERSLRLPLNAFMATEWYFATFLSHKWLKSSPRYDTCMFGGLGELRFDTTVLPKPSRQESGSGIFSHDVFMYSGVLGPPKIYYLPILILAKYISCEHLPIKYTTGSQARQIWFISKKEARGVYVHTMAQRIMLTRTMPSTGTAGCQPWISPLIKMVVGPNTGFKHFSAVQILNYPVWHPAKTCASATDWLKMCSNPRWPRWSLWAAKVHLARFIPLTLSSETWM